MPLEHLVNFIAQSRITLPHRDRYFISERSAEITRGGHWINIECGIASAREISRERTPHDSDIDIAAANGINEFRGGILLAIGTEQTEGNNVRREAASGEYRCRRSIVVPGYVNADTTVVQCRIKQRFDMQPPIVPRDYDVGRSVIGRSYFWFIHG